eukprot:jgi/Picre1/31992/NNA_007340.t1
MRALEFILKSVCTTVAKRYGCDPNDCEEYHLHWSYASKGWFENGGEASLVHGSIGLTNRKMNNASHDRVIESTGNVPTTRGKGMCRAVVDSDQMESNESGTLNYLSRPANGKQRVVVLGSGWAAMSFIKAWDASLSSKYELVLVSPRNYFVYTPLLPAMCAGTVEERSIVEPCGCVNNTFGVQGVEEYTTFFKTVEDAARLRLRVSECFERAALPATSKEERQKLLSFVIVGGGPTGVEVAAELYDLIENDLSKLYPDIVDDVKIRVVELMDHVLSTYDRAFPTTLLMSSREMGLNWCSTPESKMSALTV